MTARARLDAVDVARGLALIAMAAYHFTWDLAYFGVVEASTPFTPTMRLASASIGSAFLGFAGLSLALAHGDGLRPRAFGTRLLRIGAAAALVSAASYAMAPQEWIFFGILHCLFVASLLAVPFLRHPLLALVAGVLLILIPWAGTAPLFDWPALIWLGLGAQEPSTLDWRPLMPWGGVLLIGLALGRWLGPRIPVWRARFAPLRGLAFAGRHSLAVYLIHQPVLIALLYAALHLSGYAERLSVEAYEKACKPACVEAGGEIEACARACACVVRESSAAGLAGRLGAHDIAKPERDRIGAIAQACGDEGR